MDKSLQNIFKDITPWVESAVVCVGNFDGVHLGHQHLLRQACAHANQMGAATVAVTFHPHPVVILKGEKNRPILSIEERVKRLKHHGMRFVLVVDFTPEVSMLSAEAFISLLQLQCNMKSLMMGANSRLGHRGQGTPDQLRSLCQKKGLTFTEVSLFEKDHVQVSSSLIRSCLSLGRVDQVTPYLGRPYVTLGEKESGKGLGKKINFPTLNLKTSTEPLLKFGVYVVRLIQGEKKWRGVANFGLRPTVETTRVPKVEVHVLDSFLNDPTGVFEVEWLAQVREEKQFLGVTELQNQIALDVDRAKQYFCEQK